MQRSTTSESSDRERVLTEAVLAASTDLGVTSDELGVMLQLSCSPAIADPSDSLRAANAPQQVDLAASLVMIHRALLPLVGGDHDLARAWMKSPNYAFSNRAPKTVMLESGGLRSVLDYLSSVDSHG